MLGRNRVQPAPNQPDLYTQRQNSALSVYNAEPSIPATTYNFQNNLVSSRYAVPATNVKTWAPYVNRHEDRTGLEYNWAWGANDMGQHTASLPGGGGMDGTVRSTNFQRILVQLHDWQRNLAWYRAGWNGTGSGMFNQSNPIRYSYPSFRVPQIDVSTTGGPGVPTQRMQQRPRFTAVQSIRKATAQARYYNTTSRNNVNIPTHPASSNTYTPGV